MRVAGHRGRTTIVTTSSPRDEGDLIILSCVCTLHTVVLHVCMWVVSIHSYNPRDRYQGST